jgi:hypothetical protein
VLEADLENNQTIQSSVIEESQRRRIKKKHSKENDKI